MDLLQKSVLANAAFSAVSAVVFLIFPEWIAQQIGLSNPVEVISVGIGLLGFALYLGFLLKTDRLSPRFILPVIVGDVLWVVASVVLGFKFLSGFSVYGSWLVFGVAFVVLCFADLQGLGLIRRGKRPLVS